MASPPLYLPHSSLVGFPELWPFGDQTQSENQAIECSICLGPYTAPKVLPCLHTFCHLCLEKIQDNLEKIQCPKCKQDCILPPQGISGLLSDYAVRNIVESLVSLEDPPISCTCCKTDNTPAVASCFDCATFLCENCTIAHQYMHCFDRHQVFNLKEQANKDDFKTDKVLFCTRHKKETLRFFCMTCDIPICKECANDDHPRGLHDYDYISLVGTSQVEILSDFLEQSKAKANDLRNAAKSIEQISTHLQMQYNKAQTEITDTFNFYCSVLEERKEKLMEELEDLYNTKTDSLILEGTSIQEMVEQVQQMSLFIDRIVRYSSNSEILMFKQLLDTKLQAIMAYNPEVSMQSMELEFLSNYHTIKFGVKNTFGCIRHNFEGDLTTIPQPIARPNGVINYDRTYQNVYAYKSNIIPKIFCSENSLGSLSTSLSDISSYGKWSSDSTDIFQNDSGSSLLNTEPVIDLTSNFISANMPVKSQLKRQKMIYHCKFGEYGVLQGQFAEPSGVAVNAQNDIIVADTNNHRIQVFDKEGRFKFEFGNCGKLDGQLFYPNRVAVVKLSGDIIVTERSPNHQIQIYSQYGQFVRKFGANVLLHPRGVTVDVKGRIIVVECKVMRVVIFDQFGKVLKKFSCSKRVEFPNGVGVNDSQEIFITDNRTHCVKVFNYDGVFLRHIGGASLTNYPVGVCINQNGEILVADNHNNFNITIFTADGQVVNAFESNVKHAKCLDVALMCDGSVVLACKDYRLYIYRYEWYKNETSPLCCCI